MKQQSHLILDDAIPTSTPETQVKRGKTLLWEIAGISLAMMGRSEVLGVWLWEKLQEHEMHKMKKISQSEKEMKKQVTVLEKELIPSFCRCWKELVEYFNKLEMGEDSIYGES